MFTLRVLFAFFIFFISQPVLAPSSVRKGLRNQNALHSHIRVYFIAADEIHWDYAPSRQDDAMGHPFDDFEKNNMESGLHKIGRVYKKAVYREYFDATFNRLTQQTTDQQYLGILGPILYAEVGDTIKVVFKNNASRPYSIHPRWNSSEIRQRPECRGKLTSASR
jgi:hypothetical protein